MATVQFREQAVRPRASWLRPVSLAPVTLTTTENEEVQTANPLPNERKPEVEKAGLSVTEQKVLAQTQMRIQRGCEDTGSGFNFDFSYMWRDISDEEENTVFSQSVDASSTSSLMKAPTSTPPAPPPVIPARSGLRNLYKPLPPSPPTSHQDIPPRPRKDKRKNKKTRIVHEDPDGYDSPVLRGITFSQEEGEEDVVWCSMRYGKVLGRMIEPWGDMVLFGIEGPRLKVVRGVDIGFNAGLERREDSGRGGSVDPGAMERMDMDELRRGKRVVTS